MTVENPRVIDFVSHDPKTDTVFLSMVEQRQWGLQGQLLPDLQAKLNAYLAYALDGQFEKEYPHLKGKRLAIRLHYEFEPGVREEEFIEIVKRRVLEPAGIGWKQSKGYLTSYFPLTKVGLIVGRLL